MSRRIILPPTHLVSKRLSVPYHPWQSPLSVEATHNHDSPIYWDDIKVLALFPLVISFVSFFYFTKDDNTPRFKPPFQPLPFSTSFTNPTIPRPQPPISPPRSTFSTVAISSARGSWCEWSFCFDTDGYVKEERGERVEGEGREGGDGLEMGWWIVWRVYALHVGYLLSCTPAFSCMAFFCWKTRSYVLVVAVRRLSRRWKVKTLLAGLSPTSPMKRRLPTPLFPTFSPKIPISLAFLIQYGAFRTGSLGKSVAKRISDGPK